MTNASYYLSTMYFLLFIFLLLLSCSSSPNVLIDLKIQNSFTNEETQQTKQISHHEQQAALLPLTGSSSSRSDKSSVERSNIHRSFVKNHNQRHVSGRHFVDLSSKDQSNQQKPSKIEITSHIHTLSEDLFLEWCRQRIGLFGQAYLPVHAIFIQLQNSPALGKCVLPVAALCSLHRILTTASTFTRFILTPACTNWKLNDISPVISKVRLQLTHGWRHAEVVQDLKTIIEDEGWHLDNAVDSNSQIILDRGELVILYDNLHKKPEKLKLTGGT
jgi:hypothetical protein